ncbi:MAG TPA: ABC transporter transmembrane domain-containing protein [Chthoniobacteraceae bacterium]|jgi:ABC transporter fused permease/ATP-binding protein|nr:transporter-related protein [Chthoniobacter sp.]HEV7868192.1 ABC transporter transmembrane domain-containing protein [Chthoniobacteraceae bacterium]
MHDLRSASPRRLGDLRHLFSYLRPYRPSWVLAIVTSSISMAFGAMFPWLVGQLLDAAIPSLKIVEVQPWQRDLNTVALVLIGTLLVQAVLMFISSLLFHSVGERAVVDMRQELYGHLIGQPLRFFGEHRVGELTSRLSSDLAQIQDTLTFTVGQALRQAMLLVAGLVMIAATSVKLSLVMLSSVPVVMLLGVLFGRRIRKLSSTAQDRLATTSTVVEETLQGIANVKAFGNEPYENSRYARGLHDYLAIVLQTARSRAALIAFIIFAIFGAIVLVLWYGSHLLREGQLTHGNLTRFVFYTMFIGGAVSSVPEIISNVQRTLGATQRVRELLAEPAELLVANTERSPAAPLPRLRGQVAFNDVHFRYPSRPDLPVLRGLNLEAQPGEKIALVGPSGAGKSTLVSLLLRFYEPDAGRLLLDGQDASVLDLRTVRANMAIVPQEVLLFGGSIRENIAYGRPGASDEQIRAAAEQAHCTEFIARFPEGYETLVGERGVKLSGGQRQRLAIARALLRDPAILILDEATSSLDSESEALIQSALDVLLAGRTALLIAHRLATVRRCDRIYVIEHGTVTESGSHAELIAKPAGTYRRLAEMQFAG